MIRFLLIIIAVCMAIVSGLIAVVGVNSLAYHEKVTAAPVVMTFDEFETSRPEDTCHFQLVDLRHGSSVYPEPVRKDGEWEKVYVCMFSNQTTHLGKNYTSIIAEVDGVKGSAELAKFLDAGQLDVLYSPNHQDLPESVYNRMASKYRGMRFDSCLHVKTGGPPPSPGFGNFCFYGGIAGVAISVLGLVGFCLIKLFGAVMDRKNDPWYEDEEEQIRNRAGLPSA